jgi:hypothetical protein
MKIISSIILTLGVGAVVMSASVSPAASTNEKKEANNVLQIVKTQSSLADQAQSLMSAIKVIAPQKDLENAIRHSEQGDILLMGSDGWYRIEGKSLQQGTKMYVLTGNSSMVSAFPKEAESPAVR